MMCQPTGNYMSIRINDLYMENTMLLQTRITMSCRSIQITFDIDIIGQNILSRLVGRVPGL